MTEVTESYWKYFHVVLFVLWYGVALTFSSVNQTMQCDHSLESYWTVLLYSAGYYTVYGKWFEPRSLSRLCGLIVRVRVVPRRTVVGNAAEHHLQTDHRIDWDSAECISFSTDYYQRLTLESWFTNLERTPLNRCQQLSAPYKRLINDKQNKPDKQTNQTKDVSTANNNTT